MSNNPSRQEIDDAIAALSERQREAILSKEIGPLLTKEVSPAQAKQDKMYLREIMDKRLRARKEAREARAKAKAAVPAKPKPVALPRLPLAKELDEADLAERRKDLAGAREKFAEFFPSMANEAIADCLIHREKEFIESWNKAAASGISNPFIALRLFLYSQDVSHERDRLLAREKRVELERRVEALEDRGVGLRFVGTYRDANVYNTGDVVTYGGSAWHCNLPTCGNKPGTGEHFQLMVKRGRDARERTHTNEGSNK